ncbi:MAG: hypothetical protein ABI051_14180, partial [Vicinamibacterales bacterium]
MMSSESSTERGRSGRADTGLHPWHFFLLLSMAAATWAVVVARHTQPAALILISAAVIATGLVGAAMHHAVAGFLGLTRDEKRPLPTRARQSIEADKALVLRSIKELEFDRAMGKVNNADFAELGGRLRSRALALM